VPDSGGYTIRILLDFFISPHQVGDLTNVSALLKGRNVFLERGVFSSVRPIKAFIPQPVADPKKRAFHSVNHRKDVSSMSSF